MRASFEIAFRHDNRVTLSDARDRLGRPKVRIDWQVAESDIENMRRVTQLFDQAVRQAGVGYLERAFPDDSAAWRRTLEAGKHHMGTTRMHRVATRRCGRARPGPRDDEPVRHRQLGLSERRVCQSHADDRRTGGSAGGSSQGVT